MINVQSLNHHLWFKFPEIIDTMIHSYILNHSFIEKARFPTMEVHQFLFKLVIVTYMFYVMQFVIEHAARYCWYLVLYVCTCLFTAQRHFLLDI
jgi:hypothetical protein